MPNAVAISEKPWSDYTEADYTLEQWYNACLITPPKNQLTSKAQCKLPVRTPNGTLSRAGVHAAAAALAGARGGVNATSEEKAKAAQALIRCYGQLDEKPPPSMGMMKQSALDSVKNFLAHYGVKGMKWGVRRERGPDGTVTGGKSSGAKPGSGETAPSSDTHMSADAERFVKTTQKQGHEMSDREIKEAVNRARMVQDYNKIFNDPNGELRQKVDSLRLQKDYAQLRAELHPSAMRKVNRFLKSMSNGYAAYDKLNKATGGELNKAVIDALGLGSKYTPKHLATTKK